MVDLLRARSYPPRNVTPSKVRPESQPSGARVGVPVTLAIAAAWLALRVSL